MQDALLNKQNLIKYDVPGPRYTSYPTAPEWLDNFPADTLSQKLVQFGKTGKSLSLYIHIPFCESLCYFCGCHTVIRKPMAHYGDHYLDLIQSELQILKARLHRRVPVIQFHIGGGTPNFLTVNQMRRLMDHVEQVFHIDREGEVAIETDPRTLTDEDLELYREIGFNRISFGVQDFNPQVQKAINRFQPFEEVQKVTRRARQLHFESVNIDLIYGLPHQTPGSFTDTISRVIALKPDRIALYSYAHVPWLKPHQKRLPEDSLPAASTKMDLFLLARKGLLDAGYLAVAMDHFALPDDAMARAYRKRNLYRNFMGYTLRPADDFLGLGVSAIGFIENTFYQNGKDNKAYEQALTEGRLPVSRGKILNADDRMRQWVIRQLMCHFLVDKHLFRTCFEVDFDAYFHEEREHLEGCCRDGLLQTQENKIRVTELGRLFVRNICMGFDWYLRQKNAHQKFSRTV